MLGRQTYRSFVGDFKYDQLPGASDPAYLAETDEIVLTDAIKSKANGHDNRNHGLAAALGIKFKGDDAKASGIHLLNADLSATADATFAFDDKVLRIELKGAIAAGHYTYPAEPASTSANHDDDEDHDHDDGHDGEHDDDDHDDNDPKSTVAVTTYDYGHGRSVHLGFDALGHATATGNDNTFANLLADALVYINPPLQTKAGDVVELELTLTDKKIAATGQVELTLPEGFTLVDSLTAGAPVNGVITWPFDLAEGEGNSLRLAIRLPDTAGTRMITGMVKVRIGLRGRYPLNASTDRASIFRCPVFHEVSMQPYRTTSRSGVIDARTYFLQRIKGTLPFKCRKD